MPALPPHPEYSPGHPTLNILALPSYTTILFVLMTAVILGVGFASLLPGSQLGWYIILLPLVLLPLREFLSWPDREKQRHIFRSPTDTEQIIQQVINELSRESNTRPPQVVINADASGLYTFGTFRRRFLSISSLYAEALADELRDEDEAIRQPATALLAHELAHFVNNDMWQSALSRSLLKWTLISAAVSLWFAITAVSILVRVGPEITQHAFWSQVTQLMPFPALDLHWIPDTLQAQNPVVFDRLAHADSSDWIYAILYLANVFLPLALAVPVLYIFFWRQLMRTREYYADARAALAVKSTYWIRQAMILNRSLTGIVPVTSSSLQNIFQKTWHQLQHRMLQIPLLSYHTTDQDRIVSLQKPLRVYGKPWQIALWTGIAIVLLEFMLRSSLTMIYIVQPGPHLSLLTATIVFSIWLLPHICQGRNLKQLTGMTFQMVLIFMLVKLSINFIDLMLVGVATKSGQLGTMAPAVDIYLRSMLGFAGAKTGPIFGAEFDWPQMISWHILRPIAYYLFFGIPVLTTVLVALAAIQKLTLRLYTRKANVKKIWWMLLMAGVLFVSFVLIPLGNLLFFSMFYELSWSLLFRAVLVFLITLAMIIGLFILLRREGGTCPHCQHTIDSTFFLGQTCPVCDHVLHRWLIAPF